MNWNKVYFKTGSGKAFAKAYYEHLKKPRVLKQMQIEATNAYDERMRIKARMELKPFVLPPKE